MSKELISKATRNDFREALVEFTLHEIDMVFEAADLAPNDAIVPNVSGERRRRVEQYYANIDFSNGTDVRKVVRAFEELLRKHERQDSGWDDVLRRGRIRQDLIERMGRDSFRFEDGRFWPDVLQVQMIDTSTIVALTEASIAEHIEKARTKISQNDFAGAITNAYTLVEEFLKEVLRQTHASFNENEGDIKALYSDVAEALGLNPKGENLEGHLKTILQGLRSVISGLCEVSNRASDRHARKYNPAQRHAKLAVNAALTLCEFVLDSYENQKRIRVKTAN